MHPIPLGARSVRRLAIAAVAALLAAAPARASIVTLTLSGASDAGLPFAADVRYSTNTDDVRVCRYFTCVTQVPVNAAAVTLGGRTFVPDTSLGPLTATWSELGEYVELTAYEPAYFRLRLDGPTVPYGVAPQFDRWFFQAGGIGGAGGGVGVPEPATAALYAAAVALLLAATWRR